MASRLEELTGLIKALAWPLVALLALSLFYKPVETTLDTISARSNDIEDVKLGSIELKIRASELPRSTAAVAKSIIGLPEPELVMLLEIAPMGGHGYCKGRADLRFDENIQKPINDLRDRNLIQVEDRNQPNGENCLSELYARLTPEGMSARTFIVDLVSAQLKTANSSPGT